MNKLEHHVRRVLNRFLLDATRERKDILAMQALGPLATSYLPWSQAAMRPSGLLAVLNDIVINGRSNIVECGGGVSTFFIARLLKQRGGHLYTLEHDEGWARLLQQALEAEQLSEQVTVVQAPLARTRFAWPGSDNLWYDEERIRCIGSQGKIDLLLVDGPPAYGVALRHARYPAVPFFKDVLADDYTIILDDINRLGEQEIMRKWEQDLRIKFQMRLVEGTIAIGRPRGSFTV